MRTRKFCIAAIALMFLSGCGESPSADDTGDETRDDASTDEQQLQAATDAHAQYDDLGAAIAAGYKSTRAFATTEDGGLGVLFVNEEAEQLDPEQAPTLFYDLDEEGQYTLLGAEWSVPADQADEAPTLFGQTLDGPHDGHYEGQPSHYGLHAWLYTENPQGTFAVSNPQVEAPSYAADLEELRQAIAPYEDSQKAIDDGYVSHGECVAVPGAGGMGVHFVHEGRTGTELSAPTVLLYEPDHHGELTLVGAEWMVNEADVDQRPELMGRGFDGPMPGHAEGDPSHYDLHVWTHRANPSGLFAAFNPAVKCAEGGEEHSH